VNDLGHRSFKARVRAIDVHARVVRKTLSVTAQIYLAIGLVVAAVRGEDIGIVVAFEAGARDYVEDAESAVAIVRRVSTALDFEIVNVLRVELWTHIARNTCIRDRNPIDEPADLVPSANMELVVDDVRARNEVRNHGKAVGSSGSRGRVDVRVGDKRLCGRRGCINFLRLLLSRYLDALRGARDLEFEVQHWGAAGCDDDAFGNIAKTRLADVDRIFSDGDGVELKLAALIGLYCL